MHFGRNQSVSTFIAIASDRVKSFRSCNSFTKFPVRTYLLHEVSFVLAGLLYSMLDATNIFFCASKYSFLFYFTSHVLSGLHLIAPLIRWLSELGCLRFAGKICIFQTTCDIAQSNRESGIMIMIRIEIIAHGYSNSFQLINGFFLHCLIQFNRIYYIRTMVG